MRQYLLGAFGDPGHAFPMIALGTRLVELGHRVTLQTWTRWRDPVQAGGMRFEPAPEYHVFPTPEQPLKPYQAAVRAALEMRPLVAELRPDAVVADILTLAPALAAELEGVPVATLVPHVYPVGERGFPPYSLGARLPRTALGRALWSALERPSTAGLRQGRAELNETRRRVGLPPVDHVHGGISRQLCLVATFPQLEYARRWPEHVHVIGPLLWEPPAQDIEPPPGDAPLVLVAPSTAQDPDHRLLRACLAGLGDLPIRVLATWNRRPLARPVDVPHSARLVEWVSYSRTMPRCALVVTHGGHGTVTRALACGSPVVVSPAVGDMNENAARVDWAGVGVRVPWRFTTARAVRLAVQRALGDPHMANRAAGLGAWARGNDGADRACELLEGFVGRTSGGP